MKENWLVSQDFFITNIFKSALIELICLPNYYQILLIYANGICQVYDMVDNKIIFEEKIVKNAKHLTVSLHSYFVFSDPISKRIHYTFLEKPFKNKVLLELPSKIWFTNEFENEMSGLIKMMQEQRLSEMYEITRLKSLPFDKNNDIILIFECVNYKLEMFMNQISMYKLPEGALIRQDMIIADESLLSNYAKIIDNEYVLICPLQNIDNNIITLYLLKIHSSKQNDYIPISIYSYYPGQILGYNCIFSEEKIVLSTFFHKNECFIPKVFFIQINLQNKEFISSDINDKFIDLSKEPSEICFVSEENSQNNEIYKFFIVMSNQFNQNLTYNLIEIDYLNLTIEKIKSFELKMNNFAYNPINMRFCIEFKKEYYKEEKKEKINQKYFKLNMVGCDQKLALLFILEKKQIIEMYGRHIAYEIIEFLI